jgi:cyclopropane fatty-acyl-phospholipid synthase-like methyltransferase
MQRKPWALVRGLVVVALLGGVGLVTGPSRGFAAGEKKVTVKVLLPLDEDARTIKQILIDGKEVTGGKGPERTFTVTTTKDFVTVAAVWDPNGYTTITRKRKVAVKGGEAVADLRQADKKVEKDDITVIFVPTPDDVVEAMCRLGKVSKKDVVYDLGCGDGRMVITAVKDFGAKRGVGVDLDPDRVADSKAAAKKAGVADKLEFRQGDVLKVDDISDADVVLLYMGDFINQRLKPILKKTLKPGARVVSHRFLMGDDWKPDKTETVKSRAGYSCDIHLWVIKETDRKQVRLKLQVPEEDAVVWVDGVERPGTGKTRTIKATVVDDEIEVAVRWEPNNYTKITRKRAVKVQTDKEIVVDLRKADPKRPDDIVVRWVPTPVPVIEAMCKLGRVTKNDVVYDLGCGDGIMVFTAIKTFGAKRGVGVDIDAKMVAKCKEAAKTMGLESRVAFREGDVLKVKDLSDADVVLLYMGDDINMRLKPILKSTLKPGSRVVSHRFIMGDDWKPDKTLTIEHEGEEYLIHLWEIKPSDKK